MKIKQFIIGSLFLLPMLAIVGCTAPAEPAAVANPASEYCVEQGGILVIQQRDDGGEHGVCTFEDNRQCEEWAMLQGDCPVGGIKITGYATQAAQYCAITGGTYQVSDSSSDEEQGSCTLPDGQTCDVWAYFRGECTASSGYQPLAADTCSEMADILAEATNATVTTENADFDDYVTNSSGSGCQATATGTGADFESVETVAGSIGAALTNQGWAEDGQYTAGGPTGSASAYRLNDALCLVNVSWEPAADAGCPDDQPIAACDLQPEQQLYTAVLNCARSGG